MDWKEGITRKPKYWPFFLFFLFFLSSSAQVIDSWVTWLYLATLQILHPPNGSPAPVFESDGTRCHHAITLATLGTFIANWKNLLSAARSVWWLEHTFHHSTVCLSLTQKTNSTLELSHVPLYEFHCFKTSWHFYFKVPFITEQLGRAFKPTIKGTTDKRRYVQVKNWFGVTNSTLS